MLIYKEIIAKVHGAVIGDLISPVLVGLIKPVCVYIDVCTLMFSRFWLFCFDSHPVIKTNVAG